MHTIIENQPEIRAFEERRAKAEGDRDKFTSDALRAQQAYEAASLNAFETGGQIPQAPQPASAGEQSYRLVLAKIDKDQAEWFAQNLEDVLGKVEAREVEIIERAKVLVAELDELADEVGVLGRVQAHAHSQANIGSQYFARTPTPRPETSPAGVSLESLVDAAKRDLLLLRPPYAGWIFAGQRSAVG